MAFKQTDYDRCLPYGYRFDAETGTEYLFDRGYTPIASRNAEGPITVAVAPAPDLPALKQTDYQGYFYVSTTFTTPNPRRIPSCEGILARFVLGLPVRTLAKL